MSTLDKSASGLVKADGTNTPVGSLASYSVSQSAVPVDPRDTSGQIPTFNATVTGVADPKALVDQDVTLVDWTRTTSSGRVAAMDRNPSSGMVTLDVSTLFEKLNTEQTVLPTVLGEGIGNPLYQALEQWMLMCGLPRVRIDGNIKMALQSNWIDNYGYVADSISKLRFYGPASNYTSYVPTAQAYLNPIEVNPAQTVVFGGEFAFQRTLSEFRLHTMLTADNLTVIYTLRRDGSTWTLREKIGGAAETVIKSITYTPLYNNPIYVFVQLKAGGTATTVDQVIRIMEYDDTLQRTVYTDFPNVSVPMKPMRNRPRPFQLDMGWNDTLVAGRPSYEYGSPDLFFMTDTLQAEYPQWNYAIFVNGGESDKWPYKIPGFTGNVWDKIREFCALVELDIVFREDHIRFVSRRDSQQDYGNNFIPALSMPKSGLRESVSKRESARSVEVQLREMDGNESNYGNNLLWKADSVYSLEKGELKEEVVQTDSSFVFLNQPVAVSGVPVPYTSAFGSYVITGNDGFIVDPQWWKDNGGSITVEQTGVSGEIKIVMQAPTVDTARAPYRVSEGVADRPALYVMGKGLKLKAPKTLKFYTGAPLSAQDVGVTFDSPFMTKSLLATNTGHKLAVAYGTTSSSISFDMSQAEALEPVDSNAPLTPLNGHVYWDGAYYRIEDQTVNSGGISVGRATRHNTVFTLNGEFATGKTVADWNTLHAGKLIRDTNIAPIPRYVS